MLLAAGLRPDPLGELKRSPRPSSRNWGRVPTSNGEGREGSGKRFIPFVGDDVVAKCISNLKKTAALDTQKGANLGLKCVRMLLAAGLCPDPLGELKRSPRPSSRNWGRVPISNGEGREGNGKREERGREKGKGRGGMEGEGRGGKEGEGRLAMRL